MIKHLKKEGFLLTISTHFLESNKNQVDIPIGA